MNTEKKSPVGEALGIDFDRASELCEISKRLIKDRNTDTALNAADTMRVIANLEDISLLEKVWIAYKVGGWITWKGNT